MSAERSALTEAAERSSPGTTRNGCLTLPGLLLGAGAIGFAPIFVRVSELGPTATAFHRLLFSMPALWLWYAVDQRRKARQTAAHPVADIGCFVLAGLFFAGDLAVGHWSLSFTSVANATLFPNFAPVFVTLAGFVFFGERFSKLFLGGITIAIIGALILMGESLSLGISHLLGDALALATALFYAGYIVVVGRLRSRHGTAKIMAWSGLITCAALLPAALLSGESLWGSSAQGWLVLAALGLFSPALGQSLIAYALAHLPAASSSVALLLQPPVAALLAWVLLAEPLGPWQAAGAAVIVAGIALARRGSALSRD